MTEKGRKKSTFIHLEERIARWKMKKVKNKKSFHSENIPTEILILCKTWRKFSIIIINFFCMVG